MSWSKRWGRKGKRRRPQSSFVSQQLQCKSKLQICKQQDQMVASLDDHLPCLVYTILYKIMILVGIWLFDCWVGSLSSELWALRRCSWAAPTPNGRRREVEKRNTWLPVHVYMRSIVACKMIPVVTLCVNKTDEVTTGMNCTSGRLCM